MMNDLFEKLQKDDFQELTGTDISAKAPLTRAFLNWNLAQLSIPFIKSMEIRYIRSGGHIGFSIQTALRHYDLVLELAEDLQAPDLTLQVELLEGITWVERTVVSTQLPAGMHLDGRTLQVDLRQLVFKDVEYAAVLDHIRQARLVCADEKVFLHAHLKIN